MQPTVDVHLDPHRAGGGCVFSDLTEQAEHLVGPGEHTACVAVQRHEVGERDGRFDGGRRKPMGVGELDEGGGTHRAFEMEVQVRLGQNRQVAHALTVEEAGC